MSASLEPTGREDRIGMLDTTRGIAVLGILLMNITGFGLPNAYEDPTNWGGYQGADLAAWRITSLLFEGTMRGLFTLLFGAGALLFMQRLATRSADLRPADLYFRRTMWLILFGLINAYVLLWDGDILFYYGVVGMFLFVFRNVAPRRLLAIAAVIMILQLCVTVVEHAGYFEIRDQAQLAQIQKDAGATLTQEQTTAIEDFQELSEDFKPPQADLQEMVDAIRASYTSAWSVIAKRAWYMETAFFFRHGFLECLGMMLFGMALLKFGVLSGTASTRKYVTLLVAGYGFGLAVNIFEIRQFEAAGFATDALMNSYLTYDLGRIPMTLGHVGSIGLISCSLGRFPAFAAVTRNLAAVGQMALTNYLSQSVICMLVFTGAGLAWYGQLQRHELYYVVIAIWVLQLIVSPLWLKHFRFGPVEWLWRSLTYWRIQPMRRAAAGLAAPISEPLVAESRYDARE